jgi:hypothetical protein
VVQVAFHALHRVLVHVQVCLCRCQCAKRSGEYKACNPCVLRSVVLADAPTFLQHSQYPTAHSPPPRTSENSSHQADGTD